MLGKVSKNRLNLLRKNAVFISVYKSLEDILTVYNFRISSHKKKTYPQTHIIKKYAALPFCEPRADP